MQHIMQIAFDFDDDRVRQVAEQKVEEDMDNIIKNIILDQIAPMEREFYTNKKTRNWSKLDKIVKDHMSVFIDEHKDEIIEKAAWLLCKCYKRTKAWKEKAGEVTQ